MEEELAIGAGVRGYHGYKRHLGSSYGEEIPCKQESRNTKDSTLLTSDVVSMFLLKGWRWSS